MSFVNSVGSNVNRMLDGLGLPDSFGDAIGALVDARRADLGGLQRNLIDLQSGIPTSSLDKLIRGSRRGMGRAHIARAAHNGPHMTHCGGGYAQRQVARQSYIGQKYNYNVGPFQCQGHITGRQYCGSFSKPIQLKNDQWLFHGRTYGNLGDIWKDIRDGKVDGTTQRFPGGAQFPHFPLLGGANGGAEAGQAGFNPSDILKNIFQDLFGNIGGANGANGNNGTNGSNGATTETGADGASDIMSGPGSLEDKLLLLMDKLGKHIDKQIEDQMKKIEAEMAKQKQGSEGAQQSGGSSGGGGLFGKLLGGAGAALGGPIGGMAGSALGGLLGGSGSSNGSGSNGSGSSNGSQNSNLQLLQSQLQQMVERRNQMFQTMTQMLKSLNDTSLSIIRNLKA
ncbi:MAG: hypothetical protein IT349_02885 [Candidatus Eisenbacteria bacterium]|nr:hypothetical protein [Candidatus Eisenbacteria bacterium]